MAVFSTSLRPSSVGHGFARQIVQRGAQAAGRDHQLDAVERAAEGVANVVVLIADDGFAGHGDAEMVEPLGEEKRVGIDAVGREQFRTDRDDFSLHAWESWRRLDRKGQAFDVPVHAEKRARGGQHGSPRGQKREADQAHAAEHKFRFAVRRDARNAAAAVERGGHVETAFAVEGQSLRAAQAAVKEADLALAIDAQMRS